MGGWFHGKQCFSMLLSWSFITNLQALGALLCAVQWTSSRMLSRWITLFGLSIHLLAGADADNAGVVWVLGWPAWAVARLKVHPQAWLDTLRQYQSDYWFWKVAVFVKNHLQTSLSRRLDFMWRGETEWRVRGGHCRRGMSKLVWEVEGGRVPTGDCQLDAMMQTIQETQRH